MFANELVRKLEDKLFSSYFLTERELEQLREYLNDIDIYIEQLEKKTEVQFVRKSNKN